MKFESLFAICSKQIILCSSELAIDIVKRIADSSECPPEIYERFCFICCGVFTSYFSNHYDEIGSVKFFRICSLLDWGKQLVTIRNIGRHCVRATPFYMFIMELEMFYTPESHYSRNEDINKLYHSLYHCLKHFVTAEVIQKNELEFRMIFGRFCNIVVAHTDPFMKRRHITPLSEDIIKQIIHEFHNKLGYMTRTSITLANSRELISF